MSRRTPIGPPLPLLSRDERPLPPRRLSVLKGPNPLRPAGPQPGASRPARKVDVGSRAVRERGIGGYRGVTDTYVQACGGTPKSRGTPKRQRSIPRVGAFASVWGPVGAGSESTWDDWGRGVGPESSLSQKGPGQFVSVSGLVWGGGCRGTIEARSREKSLLDE